MPGFAAFHGDRAESSARCAFARKRARARAEREKPRLEAP
jgi:hypothetical protein